MNSLALHNGTIVTVDQDNRIIKNGTVRVASDGRITAVEPSSSDTRPPDADRVIDVDGKIVIPGLIDAHRHTDFSLVQGLFSELQGGELLKEAIALYHRAESDLDEEFFDAAWRLASLRQLSHGVTTVNAMDFTPGLGAENLGKAGLRGVVGPELADLIKPDGPEAQLADAREFIEAYHRAYDGRITASIAPGGEAGCSGELWEGIADLREEYPDLRLHTHIYDSPESDTMAAGSGAEDPLALLEAHGLLDDRTLLTHVLHAGREEAQRIAASGAHVLHCPTIYSYFRAGERAWFPLPALQEHRVNIAIGLDDPFWFDSWDLLQEAKHARLVANFEYGAQQWSSYELLKTVTINGARALGLAGEIGSLEAGKRADIVVLDPEPARHLPFSNVPSVVMNTLTGSDVATVIVNGEILMHEGTVESMDTESVIEAAEDARDRLQDTTGWSTSIAGSSPPETSIARRIAARPTLRVLEQYGRGFLSEHLP
jgi:cytosine/adenosine deaminase-related metal-dependent hydrolase